MESYWSLLKTASKVLKDADIDISRDDYTNGYTLFGWDLTLDLGEDDYFNLIKEEVCVYSSNLEKLSRRQSTSSFTPSSRMSWKSIAAEMYFTTSLLKHEQTTNQAHLRVRCKNKKLFSRCVLSKRIANSSTYDSAVRLQHEPEPQTRRTLGDNLH